MGGNCAPDSERHPAATLGRVSPSFASPSFCGVAFTDAHRQRDCPIADQMIEQLEAAQATADELGDGVATYFIECPLDELRARAWPGNRDVPPRQLRP